MVTKEEAIAATEVLEKWCESRTHCYGCPFRDIKPFDYMCILSGSPAGWEIKEHLNRVKEIEKNKLGENT